MTGDPVTESHLVVDVDRRGAHPRVRVGDRAAGIKVGEYEVRTLGDLAELGRTIVYGKREDDPAKRLPWEQPSHQPDEHDHDDLSRPARPA